MSDPNRIQDFEGQGLPPGTPEATPVADTSPPPLPVTPKTPETPPFAARVLKLIYNHNPFYLISVGCLLHGSGFWFRGGAAHEPWQLMALICGFILMLDVTAFVIVRWGKVWDDARTILLTLLVLFTVLALTFDDTLLMRPVVGQGLLIGGFLFCTLVTEGLLVGLGIRLGTLFRVPYYLLLALLFLYPVALQPGATVDPQLLSWRIWLFSPLSAVALLTLVPAIRRGREYVRDNGTPWIWPLFPWCVFLFLGAAVIVRGYALSLSFDPVLALGREAALNFETAFGGWFLVPAVLAVGLLLLEMGIVEKVPLLQFVALTAPVLALRLAFPARHPGVPFVEFFDAFRREAGSPILWTAWFGVAFYALAAIRRVKFAQAGVVAGLFALSVLGPRTTSLATLTAIQAWPLILVALMQGLIGLRRGNSFRVAIAAIAGLTAIRAECGGWLAPLARETTWLVSIEVALVLVAWRYRDGFALFLRPLTAWVFLAGASAALSEPGLLTPPHLEAAVPVAVMFLSGAAVWLSYRLRSVAWYLIGGLIGIIALIDTSSTLYGILKAARGPWNVDALLWGAASFFVAAAISAWKAGWLQKILQAFPGPPEPIEVYVDSKDDRHRE